VYVFPLLELSGCWVNRTIMERGLGVRG